MFINNYEFYDYRGVYMTLIDYLIFLKNFFVDSIFPRFLEMVFVTIQKKETLEILIPLMITLFLVQLYFGRNKDEQIGWNTAYANCIVLLFVIAHLGTYVYEKYGSGALYMFGSTAYYKTLFVLILGLVALSLMFIDYFHSIDERFSFLMSSSIFINVISFIGVVLVYSDITFDWTTVFASLFIFLIVIVLFKILRSLVPPSESAEKYLEKKEEIKEEKIRSVKHDILIKQNKFRRRFRWIIELDRKITNWTVRRTRRLKETWEMIFGNKKGFI